MRFAYRVRQRISKSWSSVGLKPDTSGAQKAALANAAATKNRAPMTASRVFLLFMTIQSVSAAKPSKKHDSAPDHERAIPVRPLGTRRFFVHVMHAKPVVIDGAFDEIEKAEADENAGDEVASRQLKGLGAAPAPEDE